MNLFRKFAIPYNGSDPDDFLKRLEPYKNNVDHIFFGLTSFFDYYRKVEWGGKFIKSFNKDVKKGSEKYFINEKIFKNGLNDISQEIYDGNVLLFLEKTKNSFYKRLLVLNKMLWELDPEEMENFVKEKLFPFIKYYKVQGVLVGEYEMAKCIRNYIPNIEIHLSVCSRLRDISAVYKWNEEIGISSFNIPHDFTRNKENILAVKRLGIPVKMIVNESCICGCPMSISHYGYISHISESKNFYKIYCDTASLRNAFHGSFLLPRHLKLFDDCVDIFKLSTRHTDSDRLFKMIDYYVNEKDDDIDVWEIIAGRMFRRLKQIHLENPSFRMPIDKISDKVIFCDCLKCHDCDICKKLMEKFFDDGGVSDLKYLI